MSSLWRSLEEPINFTTNTFMYNYKKVAVILPAYNAAKTLALTYNDLPLQWIDMLILVDDGSEDATSTIARELGIHHIIQHPVNKGYGAGQKSCYTKALALGADIVIMLHPDYQYTPKLIPTMVTLLASELYDVVLGSRMLGTGALEGGMPFYKFVANKCLTGIQNVMCNAHLAEYHTGYRAFSKHVLEKIPFLSNSDDFLFDNQMLSQVIYHKFKIGEITCPTKYFPEASSINLPKSIAYGLGVLGVSWQHLLARWRIYTSKLYK
jgi:glycosyltransferase involved in cell wall biosynthesis